MREKSRQNSRSREKQFSRYNFQFSKFHHDFHRSFFENAAFNTHSKAGFHPPHLSPQLYRFNYLKFMLFLSFKHGIFHIISVCENHKIPIQLCQLLSLSLPHTLCSVKYAWEKFLTTTCHHPSQRSRSGGTRRRFSFLPWHQKALKAMRLLYDRT